MIEVRKLDNTIVVQYKYDSINRRISKIIGNTTTTYTYTGWQVAEENETIAKPKKTKVTTRSYTYGPYIDEPIMMQITQPNGNKRSFWYLHNQQYSVYALLNDNGKLVETYRYSAYGKPSIKNANGVVLAVSGHDNTYMYTGRNQDSETGLQYFRNRYYSDLNGGFISRDQLGYIDGLNFYRGYFAVSGVDVMGNDHTEIKYVFKNTANTETEQAAIWFTYTAKDTKNCCWLVRLKVKWKEVKVPVEIFEVTYSDSTAQEVGLWTAGATGISSAIPEPFVSKAFAAGAGVVSAVSLVYSTLFTNGSTEISRVSLGESNLIGYKGFNVDSVYRIFVAGVPTFYYDERYR